MQDQTAVHKCEREEPRYNPIRLGDWLFGQPYFHGGSWRARGRNKATGERRCLTIPDVPPRIRGNVEAARALAREKAIAILSRPDGEAGDEAVANKSLADAFKEWLATIEHEVRPPTFRDYRNTLDVVLRDLNGRGIQAVSKVRLPHLEGMFRDMGEKQLKFCTRGKPRRRPALTRPRRGVCGRTKLKYLAILKRVFGWCVTHKYMRANPATGIPIHKSWSKAVAQSRFRGIALSQDQARALLEACRAPYVAPVKCEAGTRAGHEWTKEAVPPDYLFSCVLFALHTGCRLRNVAGLRWGHLRNDLSELAIPGTEMKSGEPLHVPLHAEISAHLKSLLERHVAEHHRAPSPDTLVFGGSALWLKRCFDNALRRAGILTIDGKRVRFHDTRHTAASRFERHCTFAAVQRLLGHAPQTMTHRYVHLELPELRKELDKLPWLFPASAEAQNPAPAVNA